MLILFTPFVPADTTASKAIGTVPRPSPATRLPDCADASQERPFEHQVLNRLCFLAKTRFSLAEVVPYTGVDKLLDLSMGG